MAKTDNTKQVIYDIKSAVLDTDDTGVLTLSNEEIGVVALNNILAEYLGKEIDFKIGGAVKISENIFNGEEE